MEGFDLVQVFTAPGALLAGAFVAALVQMLKGLAFPDAWQTGRAPQVVAAALSAGIVILAALDAGGIAGPQIGTVLFGYVLAWVNVSTAAIGGFEVTRKAYTSARAAMTSQTADESTGGPDEIEVSIGG